MTLASTLALLLVAATDPGDAGPFPPALETVAIPATASTTLQTDIHWPGTTAAVEPGAIPCPVVVLGHGFSRSRAQLVNVGRHLASRGYVVLVPSFSGADHAKNGDDLVALVDWILARDQDPASRFFASLDRSAIGASGHSAGGLSAIVAAARDPRIAALAPMDPVDNGGLGVGSLPAVLAAIAITYSEPSSCNANGSAETLYQAAPPTRRGVKIVGSTHCDPEDPADPLCGLVCGAADPARQRQYRRLVTGWFEYWLRCDPSYEPWVFGAEIQADVGAGLLTYDQVGSTALPCGAPPEPNGLLAARRGADIVMVWDPVGSRPPVSEYRIYGSAERDFAAPVLDGSAPGTTYTALGAATGVSSRFYRVRAYNARGEGP